MKLTHLDLFSGIGGFALAAQWANFTTIGFSEIDPFCCKVLAKRWPRILNYGDIRNIGRIEGLDLITGGFPCQPFSCAGKKKGRNDDRHLWPEFHKLIRINKPRFVVAENVTGNINMELDNIFDDLENEGYEAGAFIIPASTVGAPHKRNRVWIVAYADRLGRYDRFDHSARVQLEMDWQRDIAAFQTVGFGFIPESWATFDFKKWIGFTPDPASQRQQGTRQPRQYLRTESTSEEKTSHAFDDLVHTVNGWEKNKPPFPGVDDGLPDGLDRNKSLGNAIVPQVIFPILRFLALIGERTQ